MRFPMVEARVSLVQPGKDGWPVQGQWCYDDYLRLPDDGTRYEIIEGVLYGVNAPGYDHQHAVGEVAFQLRLFVKQHHAGVVVEAPFEVHLSDNTRPVQPDILFIRTENQPSAAAAFLRVCPT